MKKLLVCLCAALLGWAGMTRALDMEELQAKLAAQEARLAAQDAELNDIKAKMAAEDEDAAPVQMMSLQKNAKVTIGGTVTTSYFFNRGTQDVSVDGAAYQRVTDTKTGTMELSDAELEVSIDINENMDAYLLMDLHSAVSADANYGIAKAYWLRWKNICDSGFGIKVGRDKLVFGDADSAVGYLYNFTQNDGDGLGWWFDSWDQGRVGGVLEAVPNGYGSFFAPHNSYKSDGVMQVTPYWEGLDGKLMVEASFMNMVWNEEGAYRSTDFGGEVSDVKNGVNRFHSRNYGLGTMSLRTTWTPVEDLRFTASVVNFRSNGWGPSQLFDADENEGGVLQANVKHAKDNTAVALSFSWRPCFFDIMNVWSQYIRGWNVNNIDGADSDTVNFGVSFDLTDKLTFFAQGDYLYARYTDLLRKEYSTRAWAAYLGLMYDLGNGVSLEAGWRHENAKRNFRDHATGDTVKEKIKNDLLYASLLFSF